MDFVWRHVTVGILPNGFQTHTPFAHLTLHFTHLYLWAFYNSYCQLATYFN